MADGRRERLVRRGAFAAVLAAGVAAGLAAERLVVGRERRRPDPQAREPFGRLRGKSVGPVASFDGTLLHVEEAGAGDAILLVHGFALNLTSWHYQIRDLASDHRLILYDHRGHGRSGRPAGERPDWSLEALARDLHAVLADRARAEPVVLVGHSMGGMTLLTFCELFPETLGPWVSGLVLVDTTAADVMGGMLPGPTRRAKAALQTLQEGLLAALADRAQDVDRLRARASDLAYLGTRLMGFGPKPSPAAVGFVERMLAETPTEVVSALLPTLTGLDVASVLEHIDVPTLVVVGTHDRLTPPGAAERIAGAIRGARRVVIHGAGHMPMLEKPASFNAALRTFVTRTRAERAGAP